MFSIMRARSALTGRAEGWEVIGGSSLELKVAGPSMLGIGCPGRHALPLTPPQKAPTVTRAPIPRKRVRSWADSRPPNRLIRRDDLRRQPHGRASFWLLLKSVQYGVQFHRPPGRKRRRKARAGLSPRRLKAPAETTVRTVLSPALLRRRRVGTEPRPIDDPSRGAETQTKAKPPPQCEIRARVSIAAKARCRARPVCLG
jgi:hypothetical protein